METLQTLHHLSVDLHAYLAGISRKEEQREEAIEKLEAFIEQREKLLPLVKGPYNEDEMELGKEIVQLDEEINVKMKEILSFIQVDMKKIKDSKKLNRSYINPYGNIKTTDGMYLDSKQ